MNVILNPPPAVPGQRASEFSKGVLLQTNGSYNVYLKLQCGIANLKTGYIISNEDSSDLYYDVTDQYALTNVGNIKCLT